MLTLAEKYRLPIVTAVLVLLLYGCVSFHIQPADKVESSAPPINELLPFTVGIVFTDDFRSYRPTRGYPGYRFEVGPASVTMLDATTSSIFRRVEHLDELSVLPSARIQVDFVIQFDEAAFSFVWGGGRCSNPQPDVAWISYDVNLFTKSGDLVTSFSVGGNVSRIPECFGWGSLGVTRAREVMQLVLAKARDSFTTELRSVVVKSPQLIR